MIRYVLSLLLCFPLFADELPCSPRPSSETKGLLRETQIPFKSLWPDKDIPGAGIQVVPADQPLLEHRGAFRFGFIQRGKGLYLGRGKVLSLTDFQVSQALPPDVRYEHISPDGRFVYATLRESPSKNPIPLFWDTDKASYSTSGPDMMTDDNFMLLHPDGVTRALSGPGVSKLLEEVTLENTQTKRGDTFSLVNPKWGTHPETINAFTANGRYLILDGYQLLDVTTGRWEDDSFFINEQKSGKRPLDPEVVDKGADNYIGDSETFVFNRDASQVAGGYKGGYTFIWSRTRKEFIWKSKPYSLPYAFSPNGTYLMCEGTVVQASTGEAVFKDLKGISGKFSPDGRSLVTVDDEAFYIYTLPKDSEPIFGVFQAPEPWSPPRPVKKRTTPSAKKPLKKP